jgi:single-stranded-DNA-specific exonuclease
VAFALAPRINAAGRMEHAEAALRLMLTGDPGDARALAEQLSEQNERRREKERETLAEAEQMIAADVDLDREKVIVLASERWHPGVIGIVASRLVERFHRPALLIAVSDGVGKGSGRSVEAFNLWDALKRCAHLMTRFGGHHYAAGFGLSSDRICALRECINEVAEESLTTADLVRHIDIDARVAVRDLGIETVTDLNRLAPFGMGNPTPVVLARGARVGEVRRVGGDASHLSLRLVDDDGTGVGAIWFGAGELADQLPVGANVEVCCKPRLDEWRGNPEVRLHVQDIGVRDGA